MSAPQWPGPDATWAEVNAFCIARAEAHYAAVARPWGFVEVAGELRAHEAPPMRGGPSPICQCCPVRIPLTATFCRTCTAQIAAATVVRP